MKLGHWIVAALAFLFGRRQKHNAEEVAEELADDGGRGPEDRDPETGRLVPPGSPDRAAENVVLLLLVLAMLAGAGFIVVYAMYKAPVLPNELLGICMGVALVSIGAALTIVGKRLVVTEELEEDYPTADPEEQAKIVETVRDSGSRFTRKRLLLTAGAGAGGALGLAALTPVLSLGPIWDTAPLERTPWYRGRRIVDDKGRPIAAADIEQKTFYDGFAEGWSKEDLSSLLIIIRLDPSELHLPAGRSGWAPRGILAYSKICTHAGCAIELYRKPTFPTVEPEPAFVCPCHYSTFNPADGAQVIFGPAGRPLPQLPVMIDGAGNLRSAGNFSARVGPSWWGVRFRPSTEHE
ncbi:MAG TPA: ubiquinol-cytochrome c reductase iron-sulfur subunit [Solirubrobacteraceae bacterium]|nr:ubiquinol-cytochrome c reductase iron-sulfur subunit [Solirubrobacteraceae bacterium]